MPRLKRKQEDLDMIDIHVGKRMRFYRKMQNISQKELAGIFGVAFQRPGGCG